MAVPQSQGSTRSSFVFVEMSSKGLLFLNMESTVCAPDLLILCRSRGFACKGADAFAVTPCLGVPVSCVVSLGQVQEAGRGVGGGWYSQGAILVQGAGTGPLSSSLSSCSQQINLLQLFLGPQTCVHFPLNVLESRATATDLS